jgi:hypothetical protein
MRVRRVLREGASKPFWRGVVTGMRSPAGQRGFQTAYRRSVVPAAIGSFALLAWVRHARAVTNQPPLSSAGELEVCMVGAAAATAIMLLGAWLWQVWRRARAP